MNAGEGVEVWRGGVNTWECDEMGHMNVRFYVAHAMEGLVGLCGALGLPHAFSQGAPATVVVRDHHIRFMREAHSRAPLHMMAGVLEMGETDARFLQILYHSNSGEVAAVFQTLVSHVTARDERPFAWSPRTRELADGLRTDVPARLAPRSLGLEPSTDPASVAEAERMGLIRLGAGAILIQDCDVFGRMRADQFIGRVSDGVPRIFTALREGEPEAPALRPAGVGGAVLEYRVAYHRWPRCGDRFEVRSGLAAVGEKTQSLVHWLLDPHSGRSWATAEATAISLDLAARKIIPFSPEERERLGRKAVPGLSF